MYSGINGLTTMFDRHRLTESPTAQNTQIISSKGFLPSTRVTYDPLFGSSMNLSNIGEAFTKHPNFTRLNSLKQTGLSFYQFPGATHTRAVHSIQVAKLAKMFLVKILDNQPLLIKNSDKKMITCCIELAGLCHDIGHPPFSHAGETYIIKELQRKNNNQPPLFRHENKSMELVREMMLEILPNYIEEPEKIQNMIEIVQKMINGNDSSEYNFVFSIICNRFGLDVDCLAYILYDQLCTTGANETHKMLSIINNCYIYNVQQEYRQDQSGNPFSSTNYKELSFNIEILSIIERYYMLRTELYNNIYYNINTRIRERMMADAFLLVDHKYDILTRVSNNRLFRKFTDNFVDVIMNDDNIEGDAEIQVAQEIIERIPTSNLYPFLLQKTITKFEMNDTREQDTDKFTKGYYYYNSTITELINSTLDDTDIDRLEEDDFIIDKSKINQKNGDHSPLILIPFYNLEEIDMIFNLKQIELNNLQFKQPEHCFLRVYLRDTKFKNNKRDITKIKYLLKHYFENLDTIISF